MKRILVGLALLAVPGPVGAQDSAPYYGPMQRWHGIGYKLGYEDKVEHDGSWRIDTAIHGRGEAVDMALYRAAERARDEGYPFVFILGGQGWTGPGMKSATIYARPSRDPVSPTGCRSKKGAGCYTADVAEVLRVLGGPDGAQPGVAVVDHQDQFGRDVSISGFGIGAVAMAETAGQARQTMIARDGDVQIRSSIVAPLVSARPYVAFVPAPRPVLPPVATMAQVPTNDRGSPQHAGPAGDRYVKALKAAEPMPGGDRKLGWTISD